MAEHIGVISRAGFEMKRDKSGTVFKMVIDNHTYSLFDPELQKIATDNLGKAVKAIYEMDPTGKFRNVDSIEPATEQEIKVVNGRDQVIAQQVAAYIVKDLWIADKLIDGSPEVIALKRWIKAQFGALPETPKQVEVKADEGGEVQPPDEDSQVSEPSNKATEAQVKAIRALRSKLQISDKIYHDDIKARFDADFTKALTKEQASTIIDELQKAREG